MNKPQAPLLPITVYVCAFCDKDPARQETPQAQGRAFARRVKQVLHSFTQVQVKTVKCMGGCCCAGTPNGCCSVGFVGLNRFSYVLNQLHPATDMWKITELLRLYLAHPKGRIRCALSAHAEALKPHIATRIPCPPVIGKD